MAGPSEFAIGGRRLRLTNLDKVLYPQTGTTKAEVIAYYVAVADAMVPHLAGRPLTFRRWPNGVEAEGFYEKNCPEHAPGWVPRAEGPGGVRSCVLQEAAALAWAGQHAALEVHVPMARAEDLDRPTTVVLDLDPGPPADVITCCQVALELGEVLDALGLVAAAKTSGSKGLQVYVPLNVEGVTYDQTSSFALALGQLMERRRPELVLTDMTRALRPGKVLVDWSQNSHHKTTVGVYSLRGRTRPTVSTPVSWDEVADARHADDLVFDADAVAVRVTERGDLFAPVNDVTQELTIPTP